MAANPIQVQLLAQGAAVSPQLHRLLRDQIIRGEIPPGARISETEIASSWSVSRQPVREAFIKLAEEGLVEVRPQRGTFVTLISVPAVMTARCLRLLRGWTAASVATCAAVLGHTVAGGPWPPVLLVALFCTIAGYYGLQPLMADARAGVGVASFAALHGVSLAFFGVKGLAVLALAWISLRKTS